MMGSVNLSGKGKFSKATSKPKDRKKTLRRVLGYLFSHKVYFVLGLILMLSSSVIQLFGPKISGNAIQALAPGKGEVDFALVYKECFYLLLVYVVGAFLSFILNILMVSYSQKIVVELRDELFTHLVHLPISYFDQTQVGDIISRMSYDIDTMNTSLSSDVITISSSLISIVGSFVMMMVIEPLLVLVFLVTIPMSILFTKMMQKKLRKAYRLRSKSLGELNGYAEEMITGMKTVKAYSNEKDTLNRFEEFNSNASQSQYQADLYSSWNGPCVNFINNLSLAFISAIGSIMYMFNFHGMNIGKISSFVLYSRKFSGPINEVANIFADIESSLAASERVFEVLDLKEEEETGTDLVRDVSGAIKISDVSFGYLKNKEIIHHLNLEAKPGNLIAIVGPTGAGKTTIINLLMRFYDFEKGRITIDGKDIKTMKKSEERGLFSMVLQDTWLRNASIFENIRYGNPEASLEEVKTACKNAEIDDYIISLKDGYQTILNEGGDNISKGQKQLLTIARAMLLKKSMLILDEATSNVDTKTEIKIQSAMRKLMDNKTCFVIAHRLSTIQNANLILVLKEGDVVEQGTHQELLHKKGYYYTLYHAQYE